MCIAHVPITKNNHATKKLIITKSWLQTKSRLLYINAYRSDGMDIACFDTDACNLVEELYNKVIVYLGNAAQLTVA